MYRDLELKVKNKHLAEEAKIIRFEERKLSGQERNNLHEHRVMDVRDEARATYLARAFLGGVPYKVVEQSRREEKEQRFWQIKKRILTMANKYGTEKYEKEDITSWIDV